MTRLQRGQTVGVPCDIQPGAFSNEYLVSVHTDSDDILGFVTIDLVEEVQDSGGYIRAVVLDVTPEAVKVRLPGSFFTTTGIAFLSPDWASSNLHTSGTA